VSRGEIVRALIRPGGNIHRTEKIFAFYNTDYQPLMQKIEWVEGDILEKDNLRGLLSDVDQIYHAAAMISFDPGDREIMVHNNCEGTANLVDLALSLRIPRFCHVSSIAAIGTPPEGIKAAEDIPWHNYSNNSAYTKSKYLSEMEVWRAILHGLNAVIVNPSVILGPGDWKSGSPSLFYVARKGLKFYTSGGTGFVDVHDVTAVMRLLMEDHVWEEVKNQRFIINAENISFHRLFDQIADSLNVKRPEFFAGKTLLNLAWRFSALKSFLTGTPPQITHDTARSAGRLCHYDGSKICRATGFTYTPVEVAIRNISQIFLKDFGSM
jgi:dihydroflavonol-4-reductase